MFEIAVGVGSFLLTYSAVIGYGLLIGGAYLYSERQKKKARQAANASQVDRLANVPLATAPRELVLGRVRKSGVVFFRASTGAHKSKFVMCVALASHEIDGVEAVYLNDTKVTLDANGMVENAPYLETNRVVRTVSLPPNTASYVIPENFIAGTVRATRYNVIGGRSDSYVGRIPITLSGNTVTFEAESNSLLRTRIVYEVISAENSKARIRWYLGTPGQQADARLMQLFPGTWTTAHRAAGVAYLIAEFDYSETAFPNGIPQVSAEIRGAKCFDPRNGTTAFTENPALHCYHVAQHPNFGRRTSFTSNETSKFIAAANACDVSRTYVATAPENTDPVEWAANTLPKLQEAGVVGARPIYRSAIVVPFGTSGADALDDIVQSMGGKWAYSGGELHIKAGQYSAPVMSFTEADLSSGLTGSVSEDRSIDIAVHTPKVERINTVIAKIWDKAQDYKESPLQPYKVSTLVTKDGGTYPAELSMPAVFSSPQAALLSNLMIKEARDALTVTVTLKLRAYLVEVLDTVALTVSRYGWSAKEFVVLNREWAPAGGVRLTLKETSAQIYNHDVSASVAGFAANTLLPKPWEIAQPTLVSLESGSMYLNIGPDGSLVSNINVKWDFAEDAPLSSGNVEIRYAAIDERPYGDYVDSVVADNMWRTISATANDKAALIPNVTDGGIYAISIRSRSSLAASQWSPVQYHTVTGKLENPSDVLGSSTQVEGDKLRVTLNRVPDLDIAGYEVRRADSNWGSDDLFVFKGQAEIFTLAPYAVGLNTWYVKAYDTSGNYSDVAHPLTFTNPTVPAVGNFVSSFADTSLTSATVTLSWDEASPVFGLDSYEIKYNGNTVIARSTTIVLPADWIGDRQFTVETVDRNGFRSSPSQLTVSKLPPNPVANFKAQVIDNTVLLFWTNPQRTSLPVAHAKIKRGPSWATATTIGAKDGEFTTITELAGGDYTYWIAAVDTEDVESEPVSLTTKVSQPPDFVFNGEFVSTFSATRSSAIKDGTSGYLYIPVNATETFAQHFTNNGWTTPAAQISAGYPYYPQPGTSSGYYEETFDFGTVLASSNVTANLTGDTVTGSCSVAVTLSLSVDGTTFVDYPGLTSVFGSNFRHVRVRVTVTQLTSGAFYELRQLSVRLDAKMQSDAGSVAVTTDVAGTLFNFNREFVDVVAIVPSPNTTANLNAVSDFYDVLQTGTYSVSSGVATITATGHRCRVGGRVRLSPSTGGLPIGVYTVASVPNANTFTVSTAAANTSGNTLVYHNFGSLFLFNSAGTQVSGSVSWTARGF